MVPVPSVTALSVGAAVCALVVTSGGGSEVMSSAWVVSVIMAGAPGAARLIWAKGNGSATEQ